LEAVLARKKLILYGKPVSSDEILHEISDLLYAQASRPYPLRPAEIAGSLGLCKKTVYNYIFKLEKSGKIFRDNFGRFALPKLETSDF
jgi:hypothetical protein